MNDTKHIGLDVHQATISAAVLDSTGKLLMELVLETRASTILQFIHGLRRHPVLRTVPVMETRTANGVPKTVHVDGYYRKDSTYVRGYY
jgi:hypothetical protein